MTGVSRRGAHQQFSGAGWSSIMHHASPSNSARPLSNRSLATATNTSATSTASPCRRPIRERCRQDGATNRLDEGRSHSEFGGGIGRWKNDHTNTRALIQQAPLSQNLDWKIAPNYSTAERLGNNSAKHAIQHSLRGERTSMSALTRKCAMMSDRHPRDCLRASVLCCCVG